MVSAVKMKLFFSVILVLVSNFSRAENMLDYMDVTETLIKKGKYEEALERTLWFHHHSLEKQQSIYGVRLSSAINDWYNFGQKYPPALRELKKVRDYKNNRIIEGNGSYDLFADVSAINSVLSEEDDTILLFKKIEKSQPSLAKRCWSIVKDIAIRKNDGVLLEKYTIDVLSEYSQAEKSFIHKLDRYKDDDEFNKMNANIFVERSLELIELSYKMNDMETVLLIKSRAKKLVDDPRFNNSIHTKDR